LTVSELSGRIEVAGGGDLTISDAPGNVTLTTRQRDVTLEMLLAAFTLKIATAT